MFELVEGQVIITGFQYSGSVFNVSEYAMATSADNELSRSGERE
jgi:hypothetical protein